MPWICSECGRIEQDDLDFCTGCGAVREKRSDGPVCMRCGHALEEGEMQCGRCLRSDMISEMAEDRRYFIALMLAVIPGMFQIFGLGHIFLGRWVKGAVLAAGSLVLMYLFGIYDGNAQYIQWLTVADVAIYTVQFLDLLIARRLRQKV